MAVPVRGSVRRTLFSMALPMPAGTFAMIAYNLTDTWFVCRLGTLPLAATRFTGRLRKNRLFAGSDKGGRTGTAGRPACCHLPVRFKVSAQGGLPVSRGECVAVFALAGPGLPGRRGSRRLAT